MASCQACSATRQPNGKDLLECAGGRCKIFIVPKPARKRSGNLTSSRSAKPISHTHVASVKKAAKRATPSIEVVLVEATKALDIYNAFWTRYANKERPMSYINCRICKDTYRNEIQPVLAEEQMIQEATTSYRRSVSGKVSRVGFRLWRIGQH